MAGGTPEKQLRLKVFILKKGLKEAFNIGQMVEVKANQAGGLDDLFVAARLELAAEGGIVEVRSLVYTGLTGIFDGSQPGRGAHRLYRHQTGYGKIPIPNKEDLDFNTKGELEFANRIYDTEYPDGMGYVILRKDKTFAEQIANKPNTIFEIRYDFFTHIE